jgi:1-acyl-sn-glycerol-3-phosphate acyltransferase
MTSLPFYFWSKFNRYDSRKILVELASFYSKLTLRLFGVDLYLKNTIPEKNSKTGRLIVSNHLSYLDALIMQAQNPSCFVTSIEMKKTPFLGQICEAGGCLYVERRSRENLDREIEDVTKALESGLDVVIFPEGTSTNGDSVQRFKRPLFKAALNSGAEILPQTINYRFLNNYAVSSENRDNLFWYGDMSFLPHLLKIMSLDKVTVEVVIGDSFFVNQNQEVAELAIISQRLVKENYITFL